MITWKGATDLQAEQLIAYGFQFRQWSASPSLFGTWQEPTIVDDSYLSMSHP